MAKNIVSNLKPNFILWHNINHTEIRNICLDIDNVFSPSTFISKLLCVVDLCPTSEQSFNWDSPEDPDGL